MGSVLGIVSSLLWGNTGKTDDPDPVTGLTSRDRYLVQSSWAIVRKDLVKNGVTLLILLFKRYPDEQKFFPFRDIPVDDLEHSKKFHAHCANVMYSMSSVVDCLDDSELLVNVLTKIGQNHKSHKVPPQSFRNTKEVLLDLFATMMDRPTIEAYDKALEVAFKVISDQL